MTISKKDSLSAGSISGQYAGQMELFSATESEMESFKPTSKTNSSKCRKCDVPLIIGKNWNENRQKHYDYICSSCRHKENRATERANGTGRYQSAKDWEFRGVDGEGGNVPDPNALFGMRHQYLSLRVGPNLLQTGNPLSWQECLSFLSEQPKRYIYVSYFFDYDVTMIIRTMPKDRAKRLLSRHLRTTQHGDVMPLDIGDFQIDYLPHKEFKVRRKGASHWTVISDVGQFFQTSFLKTLEKWNVGTPEEREMIRVGKEHRSEFGEHTKEIEAYNALECLLLEQLMTDFRAVCWETGYVPKKWQGPGNLASAMLQAHSIPKRDDIPILKNASFRELAQAAYYGGRFETTAAGPVPGPVYQYDINGAYVAALRKLPCLTHGSWKEIKTRPKGEGNLWFGEIYFRQTNQTEQYLATFPVREVDGSIYYPMEGNGVYWSGEIEAAERNNTSVSFKRGWLYESHCECRWFGFVDDYYSLRLKLGKTTKGYVLKLAGNSLYGKLAQSIGYAPWANPIWAGIITASCRAQILDAIRGYVNDIYMIATDGIFCGVPLDLPVSRELGEWELTEHEDGIFIVQPGIYFSGTEAKSRGIERGRIHDMRTDFESAWGKRSASLGVDYTVEVPITNFITAKQAIARNKWELAGTWEETTRKLSYDWSIKRATGVVWRIPGSTAVKTLPHRGFKKLQSVPYSRVIGGGLVVADADRYLDPGLAEADRMADQPDWVRPLFSE